MADKPRHVTDAELAVMEALWETGPAAARQITDRLYPRGSTSDYATVKKLLERLEDKGFVRRDRSAAVHRFEAVVSRGGLIQQRLTAVAQSLCAGSMTPLLSHLVRATRLAAEDREALRALVDELDRGEPSQEARGRTG